MQLHTLVQAALATLIIAVSARSAVVQSGDAALALAADEPALDTVFASGTRPVDTEGNEVHAHGGCIIQVNGTYYWYGESLKLPPNWISAGVSLYSSPDLATWTNHGLALDGTAQIDDMPFSAPFRIERPKVLYNERYKYFVLLFHLDTPHFQFPAVGVAVSPSPLGPFQYRHVIKPDGRNSYDMTVYKPPGSEVAYLVRSVENHFLGITPLTADYLNTTGEICSVAPRQEAPSVWQAGSYYFIFSSHLTGWDPNAPMLFRARSMCADAWEEMPVPAEGPGADTTYNGQAAYVLPYTFDDGSVLNVWMGDRWNPKGPGSVANATNLWLPLLPRPNGQGFYIKWAPRWTIRQYRWAAVDPGPSAAADSAVAGATLLAGSGVAAGMGRSAKVPPALQGQALADDMEKWAALEAASGSSGLQHAADSAVMQAS